MQYAKNYLAKILAHLRPRNKVSFDLKPLLVYSTGRSGTTLLMQILETSPRIVFDRVYPYEVRYLSYLLNLAHVLKQGPCPDSNLDFISSPSETMGPLPYKDAQLWNGNKLWITCFKAIWREFSKIAIAKNRMFSKGEVPFLYYAEKAPWWVPNLLRQAMTFKSILLVRDPRDIFLSINAFDKKRGFQGFNRRAIDDDWSYAKRFVDDFKQGLKIVIKEEADPENILVKYEHLVFDLQGESKRLGKFLDVEFDIEAVEKQRPAFFHHMTSKSPMESVERWRRELAPGLNEYFVEKLHKELKHFGYEV